MKPVVHCALIGLLRGTVSSPLPCLAFQSVGLGVCVGALLGTAQDREPWFEVLQEDTASGTSKVRVPGIVRDVWTLTKFLITRPMKDPYGVIETPETVRFEADQPADKSNGIIPPRLG